jgi:hypothetical protein
MVWMIKAGMPGNVNPESGEWLFIDVGFAQSGNKSCGLLSDTEPHARALTFEETAAYVIGRAGAESGGNSTALNLVVEAPLSVAFDREGNPFGRVFERLEGHQPRYWYMQGGWVVMMAAVYLLRALHDSTPRRRFRPSEGFVSFKPRGSRSRTARTFGLSVPLFMANRDLPAQFWLRPNWSPNTSERITSAFSVAGMNVGVPPVIRTLPARVPK